MTNYAELATEHNKKVNTLAGQLEKINEMLGITKASTKIAIVDDNRIAHYMDDYLTSEQQKELVGFAESTIEEIRKEREAEFNKLIGVENKIEEVADQDETVEETQQNSTSGTAIDEDVSQKIIDMLKAGEKQVAIAKKLGVNVKTVRKRADELGMTKPRTRTNSENDENSNENTKEDKTHVELTKELVRSKYTLTDKSLDDVAKELGVTKYELHDFIAKNGLRRPSKKEQKVFRDAEVQKKRNTPS